jgi:CubicO group peptidase (beta-lactamase class C family)
MKRRDRIGIALGSLALLTSVSPLAAQLDALRDYVDGFRRTAQLPGVAVVVVDRNGPLFVETFGGTEVDGAPFTPRSAVYLGPATETMTALGILQLAESGAIDLDAPAIRYLPALDFPPGEPVDPLTVRHLLTDSSGLPTIAAFSRRVRREGRMDRVRFFAAPGEEARYSRLNSLLLGQIIEAASGRPYGTYMRERVFSPLGMSRTTADRDGLERSGLAQGHTYFMGWPIARTEPAYADRMIPTGYVITTADDLGRYLSALLAASDGVGPGWEITRRAGERALYRAGTTPGFYAALAVLPDVDRAVAVLATRSAGPFLDAPGELLDGVLEIALGRSPVDYFPWERILRLGLIVLIVAGLVRLFRVASAWRALGGPRALAHTSPILGRVVLDLALAAAVPLWIILGLVEMPIQAFLERYPDLGIALILLPVLVIPDTVLRSLVTSERWRLARAAEHAA